ncbi:Phage Terminase [Corynebacterium kalinowskii]|uniref:Phage Terminase n=1 Tax=Corynebacterium kalinowskii TaxID=2675216 RepID=A0A6B8VT66_9CORY|nr:terminase [Corynebacterium kalinowskii]QGU03111.1 Phage Terminase [Corynebacterium kalinowskii]
MAKQSAADILDTLPPGLPKLTLGWEALAWSARYLIHPNGQRAGLPWKFRKRQARFILWFYAVDENGNWLFGEAHRRLAKGSGKTPFAAALALIEFLAPVRFAGFDPDLPGGCFGKPVPMAWVQISAVSESQTKNTMRMIRAMVNKKKNPRIHQDYDLDVGKTQINADSDRKLEVITSSAATAEGGEATFIVADELEHWTPANGGTELHATLMDNLAKTGSRMLGTMNAWKPGMDTVAEEIFEAWAEQYNGRSKAEREILMDAVQAPPDTDLADPDSLRAGLEFVYADCPWVDIDSIMSRIWTKNARPDDSKRKFLNWPTADLNAWADPKDWAQMARFGQRPAPGTQIVMFFDGSLSRDTTALVGCEVESGHVFQIGVWDPHNSHDDDNRIDVLAVDAAVQAAFDTWEIPAFFGDVREWESFTKVTWPERYKDQLEVWAVPSGNRMEAIAWDMRSKTFDFTRACELTEREILEHAFTHDGSVELTDHVRNAMRAQNRYGVSVRKESPNSAKKIDAAVCMIGARMVRRIYLEQAEKTHKYDGRAVFV